MSDGFEFCDTLGPTEITHVYEPKINLRGILVVDNATAGLAYDGDRQTAKIQNEGVGNKPE